MERWIQEACNVASTNSKTRRPDWSSSELRQVEIHCPKEEVPSFEEADRFLDEEFRKLWYDDGKAIVTREYVKHSDGSTYFRKEVTK